jgi:hypothetical protein
MFILGKRVASDIPVTLQDPVWLLSPWLPVAVSLF